MESRVNIFYLDPDPIIAASMHCDQHLNKMILESAQMLSTAMHERAHIINLSLDARYFIYKSAYTNHPCTKWVCESNHNMLWLCELSKALQSTKEDVDSHAHYHTSLHTVLTIEEYLKAFFPYASANAHTSPIFCGPALFKEPFLKNKTISERYQAYYLYKAKRWALDGKARMSYKGRSVPDFLKDCEYVSQ
jgi:hypothetical protein